MQRGQRVLTFEWYDIKFTGHEVASRKNGFCDDNCRSHEPLPFLDTLTRIYDHCEGNNSQSNSANSEVRDTR